MVFGQLRDFLLFTPEVLRYLLTRSPYYISLILLPTLFPYYIFLLLQPRLPPYAISLPSATLSASSQRYLPKRSGMFLREF